MPAPESGSVATYIARPHAMSSNTGIITRFALSMPFFTPTSITTHVTAVNSAMHTNGSHGDAMNESKNACGSSRPLPPDIILTYAAKYFTTHPPITL